ncbi:unnamed protein product [marine sediment metagenome]|uniref:Uncharacterized protein n=1 Tax=marine sediment metagenome TaxID=412755 RepID=X0YCJ5_9ZZZZ
MRVVTLARTPLSESNLAYNVMEHGTGGLHIKNTRLWRGPWPEGSVEAPGLWPANVLLMHRPTCKLVDWSAEVTYLNRWEDGAKPFGNGAGHAYKSHLIQSRQC